MMPRTRHRRTSQREKVSWGTDEGPWVMWKSSIAQAPALALLVLLLAATQWTHAADLVIEIPAVQPQPSDGGGGGGGSYRLDYSPPQGSPPPNHTVPAQAHTITFQGLPGTTYHFMLYYSNDSLADLLTWNQSITTAPEPPANLTVALGRGKAATVGWAPPAQGSYTGFRFLVAPLAAGGGGGGGSAEAPRNVTVQGDGGWSLPLKDLAPGAAYSLHAFTLLHDKESAAYASRNFTTKPNTPGKFIVWFRNETTLLVLWQPPYPPGQYSHYKVSIVPPDARDSELYVEREGEPPGPAQAAFKGLLPGRAYNISVQTVAEPELSAPTTAQYRTVPLRPRNVTVAWRGETAFAVAWLPPAEPSEFERYQVAIAGGPTGTSGPGGTARRAQPVLRARDEPPRAAFEGLEPGAHYAVTVKTMSGKVTSWPAHAELTLRPLPVRRLQWRARPEAGGGGAQLWWEPSAHSQQDEFRVSYHEAGPSADASALSVGAPNATLAALLPGRNYTVAVAALSRGVPSNETLVAVATPPLAPVLRAAAPAMHALALAWRSDVNSRQDAYELRWWRRGEDATAAETLQTRDTNATLAALVPGALYEVRLCALSHGLRSEWLSLALATRPPPPQGALAVARASSDAAAVEWRAPPPQPPHALGGFVLRWRPTDAPSGGGGRLQLGPSVLRAEVGNLTRGELYEVSLDTLSEGLAAESGRPLRAQHAVRPAPVSDVAARADARQVALEWPRPQGVVHWYLLRWRPQPEPSEAAEGPPEEPPDALRGGERNVSAAAGERVARAELDGLWPGAGYLVTLTAHAHGLQGDEFALPVRARPLIASELTVVHEQDGADAEDADAPSILVQYTRTPPSASRFDHYRFRLEGERDSAPREVLRARDAPGQRVAFGGLVPGRLYNVTMWTVSRNATSLPVQRQARLFPRPVRALNASRVGARDVLLAWEPPAGDYTDFEVQYLTAQDSLANRTTAEPRLLVDGLRPHTLYTFTVEVRSGAPGTLLTRSPAVSAAVGTREAPPDAPTAFRPVDARPSELLFAWELPARARNGVLRRFLIEYAPVGAGAEGPRERAEFPPEASRGAVGGLTPGATYEFSLRGETAAGAGEPARWTQHMGIGAPPRPPPHAAPQPARATATTVAVRFRGDLFSSANGNVTAYTLVAAMAPRNDTAPVGSQQQQRLPSWRDVRHLPLWPPYQVTEPYYPFHAAAARVPPVEEFTLGAERCEDSLRAYCNGPLRPGTAYYVKLRAYTAPDKFTDTAYTLVYTDVDNTAWAWAGGALAAAAAGGAVLALLVRRRRSRRAARAAGGLGGPGAGAAGAGGGGAGVRASRPVRVHDFVEHYRLMSADSDFRFSEEFEELKHVGREQPCSAADLPVNRPKNRFTNILPYDHSRYKLQPVDDEEGSDYINANYVPGHNGPREFIVTQGPLHCTRDDFWRMVWESGSRAVVMLTRCVEKGREKCDRYWPADTRPLYYGDIAVTALNESRQADWTVTELLAARGAEQRRLLHFHFTTWPDFGVPDPPTTLARFVRAFRERVPPDARPVVVHCSAGVGRSGTFVALDRALQQLAARHDHLDVFGMVHAMRRERVWMVQTEQQYIAIHQCLVAVLEGQDLQPPAHPAPPLHAADRHERHNAAFDDDEGIAESGM